MYNVLVLYLPEWGGWPKTLFRTKKRSDSKKQSTFSRLKYHTRLPISRYTRSGRVTFIEILIKTHTFSKRAQCERARYNKACPTRWRVLLKISRMLIKRQVFSRSIFPWSRWTCRIYIFFNICVIYRCYRFDNILVHKISLFCQRLHFQTVNRLLQLLLYVIVVFVSNCSTIKITLYRLFSIKYLV